MLSQVNINSKNIIDENNKIAKFLMEKYSGFREFYDYAQEFLIKNSPEPSEHQYPNPLYIYPSLSNSSKLLDFDEEDEPQREQEKENKSETLKMKKKAEQIDDKKETDGLLLFLPESLMSLL